MNIKRTIIATLAALTLVALVAPAGNVGAVTVEELMAQIAQLQAQLQGLSGTTGGTGTGACAGVTFTRNLTVGSTGSDVKCLQQLLNNNGYTVATTGAGSPGAETTYFGSKTLVAVKAFQVAKGWTPANQVGPMTRAALNALIGTTGGTTNPQNPTGPVSATLSFDNPVAGSLINSQAQADLLHINFTGSGTVTSVTLQRSGISDQNTLTGVYLYDGAVRLTDSYAFNSTGTLTMNGLSIPVNGSHVISVKADVYSSATTASSSIALKLTGLTANGTATTANVQGNTFAIVTGTSATAWLAANSHTASTTSAGTLQQSMWTSSLQVNTRTVQLKGVSYKMVGSAPTNALANIKLFVDGIDTGAVATVGTIQGSNYAMFNFATPVNLTTGSHALDVRADVVAGAYRTIQFSLQQTSDMVLYDPQVGVNFAVLGASGAAFSANSGTSMTISQGSSTVVVDPTFGAQTTVTAGATNAVIGKYTIHGYGEDVKVSTLQVTPLIKSTTGASGADCVTDAAGARTSGTCGLNNVTLYFNGSQIGSQTNWTSAQMIAGTTITFTLGSQMIIPAGQDSTLEVRADLQIASNANYTDGTISVTLEGGTSQNNATGQSSSETIDVPTSDQATSGLTISSASLAVTKSPALASYTASPNTPDVRIGSFVAQNNSTSEAVRLTTLTIALTSDGTTALTATELTGLSALRTSVTSGAGATPIQPAASNVFSINETLQPGASKTIDIFANVGSSSLISAVATKLTVASIGATSNISSSGTVTTGQTVSFTAGSIAAGGVTLINTPTVTTPTQFVVGGTGNVSKATFNFVASNAPATVSELRFTVSGTTTNMVTSVIMAQTGAVNANCPAGYTSGYVCGTPTGSAGAQTVYLTGLNFNVPTTGVTKEVLFAYGDVGLSGITPGSSNSAIMTYVKYTSGGSTSTVTPTAGNVTTNTAYLVSAIPTVTIADTGASFNRTTSGTTKAASVTVTAGAQAVRVRQLSFDIGFSGYSSNPTLGTTDNDSYLKVGNTSLTSTFTCSDSSLNITCVTAGTYATDYIVPANSSVTFDLYVNLETAGTLDTGNTGSMTVTLAKAGTAGTTTDTTADFLWDDTSTAGGSGYGPYSDYYLPSYPTESVVAN